MTEMTAVYYKADAKMMILQNQKSYGIEFSVIKTFNWKHFLETFGKVRTSFHKILKGNLGLSKITFYLKIEIFHIDILFNFYIHFSHFNFNI